jgi:hypothetical protein
VQAVAHPAPAAELVIDEAGRLAAHGVEVEHGVPRVIEPDAPDGKMHLAMWARVVVGVVRRQQIEASDASVR